MAAGTYRLRVEHLEYETYTSMPFTVDGREDQTLPEIVLRASVNELSEVVVTYRKPLIEVRPGRLVFNVASSRKYQLDAFPVFLDLQPDQRTVIQLLSYNHFYS